jgi:translocation protein SEC63
LETINDHWVEITKAFKALTDEEIRNNFIQYGHPDGKQSFSMGIGLPNWLIEPGNGKYVIIFYGLVLGILLPFFVGKWWYGTQRLTKDKVLVASAGHLFQGYNEKITEGEIIHVLSKGEEFKELLKGDRAEAGESRVESKILAVGEKEKLSGGLTEDDKSRLEELDGGLRRKTLSLLWAYLLRQDLDDQKLNDGKALHKVSSV